MWYLIRFLQQHPNMYFFKEVVGFFLSYFIPSLNDDWKYNLIICIIASSLETKTYYRLTMAYIPREFPLIKYFK